MRVLLCWIDHVAHFYEVHSSVCVYLLDWLSMQIIFVFLKKKNSGDMSLYEREEDVT